MAHLFCPEYYADHFFFLSYTIVLYRFVLKDEEIKTYLLK